MNHFSSHNLVIENGLDLQNAIALRQRFMAINEDRLERMRGALSDRQQVFMDSLALLFHVNHPMLPGFVSRQTPARVANFKPSRHDLLVGKSIAKSFTFTLQPEARDDIYAIFIMGSVGTIAQSGRSDLDIWLCHRPGLPKKALRELELKCEYITTWASKMRLEVHFFLMDNEAFKARKFTALNKESSGSAQQLLLLDEFYRSAIYICGQMPLWWHVPVDAESQYREYTNTLLYKRFVAGNSVLDFGGIDKIPPGEFLGAGIWQLYKAIESPYKSVLKLLLLEVYVAEYPNITPLSHTFKHLIYQGELNIDALDSYVMIYHRIEQYLLEKEQFKRLELVRRCFYFKVGKKLSAPPQNAKSWQRKLLEQFTESWGWSMKHIQFLDSRPKWKAVEVNNERSLLVAELNHSYHFLMEFAGTVGAGRTLSSDEQLVLGRKLQAAFERRPGKIEWINPSISNDIAEDILMLSEVDNDKLKGPIWTAFSCQSLDIKKQNSTPIKSSTNLIELIFWCYFNGVIEQNTRVECDQSIDITPIELKRLLSTFRTWLPLPMAPLSHSSFQQTAKSETALFLINAGVSPTPQLDSIGYQRMSARNDALSYGGFEENLVASIDTVVRNSWNEINVRHFKGKNALLDAITEYLQFTIPGTHQRPPTIKIVCIGNAHATTISQRVENWINEITRCFFANKESQYNRFIFQLANAYYCLQFKSMKPKIQGFMSESHLISHLEQEQLHYSQIIMDSRALPKHPINTICKNSRENSIDVFFRRFDIGIEIYIVDERGSVLKSVFRGRQNHNPLRPLYRFLRSVLYRQANIYPEFHGKFGIYPINVMELVKTEDGIYQAKPRKIVQEPLQVTKFDFKVVAFADGDNEVRYNFYCEDQEFAVDIFGDQLELVIGQFILSRRDSNASYPIYITDLDLSMVMDKIARDDRLQIVHYLRIKHRLEAQLNKSINVLINA
ncbi:class I adenylate cyclase [Agarilytica rhodophyticola]|uniref:class I adenylate cyclase n=1 Tax=Agarilytica rhodophyticola TaxID=1737490 RepID=UPI001FE5CC9C|nr:class I adenylate cyclase [Agarilytica rhodophyticola]